MSELHCYDFNEDAIRREVKLFTISIMQTHEVLVTETLKSARLATRIRERETSDLLDTPTDHLLVPQRTPKQQSKRTLKLSIEIFQKSSASNKRTAVETPISLDYVAPLPLYKDYTPLSVGINVEDDEYLRYLPYFGENGEEDGLNLEEIFEDRTESHSEQLRKEKAQFFSTEFFGFIGKYGIQKTHLASYAMYHVPSNPILRREIFPDWFEIEDKKRKVFEEHLRKLDAKLISRIEMVAKLFKEITKISFMEFVNLLPATFFVEDKRASLRSSQTSSVNNLDSYQSLLCTLCYMHECPWHESTYVALGADGAVKSVPLSLQNRVNKSYSGKSILPDDIPCSNECFINERGVRSQGSKAVDWSEEEISMIKMTAKVMMRNDRYSCLLVTLLDRPCYEIYQKLTDLKLSSVFLKPNQLPEHDSYMSVYASQLSPSYSINTHKRKRKTQSVYPDNVSLSGNHLKRGSVSPCMHSGPCDESCPCVDSQVFCEKSCGCSASCPRRYRGCRCTASRCRTIACECFKWNRECDPDLCRGCGADEVLDPKNRDIIDNKRYCKNVNLQRALGKRVIVGPSIVAGWGLFLGEDMKQDEFLGEYKGELISQDEAERRGKIYDKRGVSFLFEATKDKCVDATRAGNKLRFINHSRQNPNCNARILLVNGVHRIAFFSRRRIKEGEELFIDYGYNNKTMKFVPLELGKTSRADSHH
ncbi:uncharacterized protein V1516DRAFT_676090 [Lipomyces oligophaga]|uniref:uncharacterized protein n=1 Tax=Lipomyces oligophaga TaxID=45792 RepID=UPI0034CE5464